MVPRRNGSACDCRDRAEFGEDVNVCRPNCNELRLSLERANEVAVKNNLALVFLYSELHTNESSVKSQSGSRTTSRHACY